MSGAAALTTPDAGGDTSVTVKKIRVIASDGDRGRIDGQSKIVNWAENALLAALKADYAAFCDKSLMLTWSGAFEEEAIDLRCEREVLFYRLFTKYSIRDRLPALKEKHRFLRLVHSSPLKNAALRLTASRTLLSRPNIEKLISKTDLDLSARTPSDRERLVSSLAADIHLWPQTQNLFSISYRNPSPRLAHDVVQTVLAIFVESATSVSRTDMENARRFLGHQIAAVFGAALPAEPGVRKGEAAPGGCRRCGGIPAAAARGHHRQHRAAGEDPV
jgi:hypothetical protein